MEYPYADLLVVVFRKLQYEVKIVNQMNEKSDIWMSLPSLRIVMELATRCCEDDVWEDVELLPYRNLRNSQLDQIWWCMHY